MLLVPATWLLEYVDHPADIREVAHRLTLSGTNVEGVEGGVLKVEVTPNRGDCLSMIGLARELSAASGQPMTVTPPTVVELGEPAAESMSIEIEAPDLCPRYSARLVRNVAPKPSPAWMQERLIEAGLRPINVIVDVTNYVMLEYGQPLHAFDFERIRGRKIVVRRAREGEPFVALDGQERTLDSSILTICDAEGPVAIAGIRGGENSVVAESTRTVLLESAHFDAVAIRAASKRLGMSTDSSYRFERGVDPSGTIAAVDRAAQLLQDLAGAEVAPGVIDVYPRPIDPVAISYRPERGDRLIGRSITREEQRRCLEGLGLSVSSEGSRFSVTVPTFRPDLEQEDDLVEEVARISGYDRIPYRLPGGEFFGSLSETQIFVNRVRAMLKGCGLQEALTHTLVDPSSLSRFSAISPARVRNPLSEEFAALRTTLIAHLVDVAERNARYGRRDINVFEVGQVFIPTEGFAGIAEPIRIAGLLCGSRMAGRWNMKPVPLEADFFAAKGIVEALLDALRIDEATFETAEAPGLHPGRTARLRIGGEDAGFIGQIHPAVQDAAELPGETYVFDLSLAAFRSHSREPRARAVPRFPGVTRDLAMLAPVDAEAAGVKAALVRAGGSYLEDATLFDVYTGTNVPEGRKSLAFSLVFRAPDRTLNDSEIDTAIQAIRDALADEIGAIAR